MLPFGKHRHHLCHFTAHVLQSSAVLKLAGRLLEAEVEAFLFEITQATLQLFRAQFADFSDFCQGHGCVSVERLVFVAAHETSPEAELVGCETHGFTRQRLRNTCDFK